MSLALLALVVAKLLHKPTSAPGKLSPLSRITTTLCPSSPVFDNVFLRLDGAGVAQGETLANGGGVVNAQYTANTLEKFRIQKKVDGSGKHYGIVGIESLSYVWRYLRLDGAANKVNVQDVFGTNEEFRILVVGK